MVTDEERRLQLLSENYVSVTTAAQLLGITSSAVNQRIARGALKAERLNPGSPKSRHVISLDEIERARKTGLSRQLLSKNQAEALLDPRKDGMIDLFGGLIDEAEKNDE